MLPPRTPRHRRRNSSPSPGALAVLALVAALAVSPTAAPQTGAAARTAAQILEPSRASRTIPALAAIVVKEGVVVDRAVVGVRKLGDPTPIAIGDRFHLGSCTKSMTATLAAMLVDEGKLTWTRTIAEAFPELKATLHPQYAGVTLRQLLAHMGGAPAAPPPAVWERAVREQGTPIEQRREYVTGVLTQPPEAAPGSRFIYSNQGFVIAGVMIERAAGQPWETLMRERLFAPLGMTSAGFGSPAAPSGRVDQPWGHADDHGTLTPTLVDNPIALGPAGRVHASLDDMARYARFHLRGERAPGRPPLLAPETLRLLHTRRDQEIYGFGWAFVEQPWTHGPAITHAGSNNAWFMSVWIAPARDAALVVATNAGGPVAEAGAREAVAALVTRFF